MKLLDQIHEKHVYGRRTWILSEVLAQLIPENSRVLDVGCGDGQISKLIQEKGLNITIEGIDILLRPRSYIPVKQFDGKNLPYNDCSFDVVLFVDVLHHTNDPIILIREAARVTKRQILLKDHTRDGFLAEQTLRFMDLVGNERHGVSIPANYWPERFGETHSNN